jgi:RNA polymerase sigma factor (sigma-70 family)
MDPTTLEATDCGSADRDRRPRMNRGKAGASNRAERQREAEQDGVLVQRAQRGDKQAFRQLVERHQRRAFAIAIGFVRDENDAREIVQEAFLRVFRSLDKFQGGSSFFTWLYRIVVNLSIDLMRKPARREAELFDNPGTSDEAESLPFVAQLEGADPLRVVATLPPLGHSHARGRRHELPGDGRGHAGVQGHDHESAVPRAAEAAARAGGLLPRATRA